MGLLLPIWQRFAQGHVALYCIHKTVHTWKLPHSRVPQRNPFKTYTSDRTRHMLLRAIVSSQTVGSRWFGTRSRGISYWNIYTSSFSQNGKYNTPIFRPHLSNWLKFAGGGDTHIDNSSLNLSGFCQDGPKILEAYLRTWPCANHCQIGYRRAMVKVFFSFI